jgi:hypothetical protein
MAIERSEGERAECGSSLVHDELHVNDKLRLGLFGHRRTKQGLALAFQRDGRGCEGDVGVSEGESGVLLIMGMVGLCHDVASTDWIQGRRVRPEASGHEDGMGLRQRV